MDQLPASSSDADTGQTAMTIKRFMGRTPGVIKSKFLSVLGNSTDIISGISNKVSKYKAYLMTKILSKEKETIIRMLNEQRVNIL